VLLGSTKSLSTPNLGSGTHLGERLTHNSTAFQSRNSWWQSGGSTKNLESRRLWPSILDCNIPQSTSADNCNFQMQLWATPGRQMWRTPFPDPPATPPSPGCPLREVGWWPLAQPDKPPACGRASGRGGNTSTAASKAGPPG